MLAESPVPLYYQVANILRHRILDGHYNPGERIGTEKAMCDQFGVSRITVRQAFDQLEREDLIVRLRGAGTFVSGKLPKAAASMSFTGYLEDLFAQVLTTETRDARIEQVVAGEEVATALQIGSEEIVTRIARVRLLGGVPLAHTVSYVPLSIGADITMELLQHLPLMHVLEQRLGVHLNLAIQTILARKADAELARMLEIQEGDALLLVRRMTYSRGRAVEYVLTHYRADRYQYTVRLGRIEREER